MAAPLPDRIGAPPIRIGPRYRRLVLWVVGAALAATAAGAGLDAVEAALRARGIATGFGFLDSAAGFQISQSLIPATAASSYARVILAGLANGLLACGLAASAATVLGLVLGLMRLARHPLLRMIAAAVVEPLRNTPVLLQLFLWYGILMRLPGPRAAWHPLPGVFLSNRGLVLPAIDGGAVSVPALQGFNFAGGWTLGPELTTLAAGLTLFHASYLADTVRAGIDSVSSGQSDAAKALGLAPLARLRLVVLPQALRLIVPPAGNQYVGLVKNSALAVAIGYPDLASVIGTTINQTGQAVEGSLVAILLYLALGLAVAGLIAWYRRVTARPGGFPPADPRPHPPLDGWRACVTPWPAALATLALALVGLWAGIAAWRWAVADAVWIGTPDACARATGACWAVLSAKYRLLLFGLYPAGEQWRAATALAIAIAVPATIARDRLRHPRPMLGLLAGGALLWCVLMGGGGVLPRVPMADWGGLPLTLGLAIAVLGAAAPLAVPLALARGSARAVWRVPATALIDGVRGVPLVVLLLASTLILPLLLPAGWSVDKLVRAWLALAVVTGAYLAEALRGGLAAVPAQQLEAARALGLDTVRAYRLVVLPQAVRLALPALVNTAIGTVKDTSLVLVVGLYDLLAGARTAVAEPQWRAYAPEAYLAAALVYFALCFALARYERRLAPNAVPRTETSRSMSSAVL